MQTWKHGQVPKWWNYSKFAVPLNFTGMVALAEPKLLPIGDWWGESHFIRESGSFLMNLRVRQSNEKTLGFDCGIQPTAAPIYVFVPKHKTHHDNGKHPEKEWWCPFSIVQIDFGFLLRILFLLFLLFDCCSGCWFIFLFLFLLVFVFLKQSQFAFAVNSAQNCCTELAPNTGKLPMLRWRTPLPCSLSLLFSFGSQDQYGACEQGLNQVSGIPITWHHAHPWAVSYFMAPLSFFLYFPLLDGGRRKKSFKIQLLWFSEESCW